MNYSDLWKKLKPYAVADIRAIGTSGGTNTSTGGVATMAAHEIADTSGLGAYHTVTAGANQVLVATGTNTAHFAQLTHSQLTGVGANDHHNQVHSIFGTDHTITGAQYILVGASATNTLGTITPDYDVSGGETAIIRSQAGSARFDRLTMGTALATSTVTTPQVDSATTITFAPTSAQVLPTGTIEKDLGDYNRKWRTLYAAELYVETLVAQDVLATIGGRVMVAPTTELIADVGTAATTIDVKHNNLGSAYLYLSSAPGGVAQVEFMKVSGSDTPITGGYRYTVSRNLDGSGLNTWVAGDAVVNTGKAAGEGYIDLTSTSTIHSHLGPTVTTYVRSGTAAYSTVKPVTSMGNLRSFVDYGADEYGFAVGDDLTLAGSAFSGLTADRTNGLRMFNTDIAMYSGTAPYLTLEQTNGIQIVASSSGTATTQRAYTFNAGIAATTFGGMYGYYGGAAGNGITVMADGGITNGVLDLRANSPGTAYIQISAATSDGVGAWLTLRNASGTETINLLSDAINLSAQPSGNTAATITGTLNVTGAVDFDSTLNVDGTLTVATINKSSGVNLQYNGSAKLATVTGGVEVTGYMLATSDVQTSGTLRAYGSAPYFRMGNDDVSTGSVIVDMGLGRTGSGASYINLIGDTTYTDYGLRLLRNGGNTGNSEILHRGTGILYLNAVDAADVKIKTNNTNRLVITSTGETKAESGLYVNGDAGGIAGYVGFTDTTSGVSSGTGKIMMNSTSSNVESDGWLTIYIGTTTAYIPYWTSHT